MIIWIRLFSLLIYDHGSLKKVKGLVSRNFTRAIYIWFSEIVILDAVNCLPSYYFICAVLYFVAIFIFWVQTIYCKGISNARYFWRTRTYERACYCGMERKVRRSIKVHWMRWWIQLAAYQLWLGFSTIVMMTIRDVLFMMISAFTHVHRLLAQCFSQK